VKEAMAGEEQVYIAFCAYSFAGDVYYFIPINRPLTDQLQNPLLTTKRIRVEMAKRGVPQGQGGRTTSASPKT
jgi:hypothetical protein